MIGCLGDRFRPLPARRGLIQAVTGVTTDEAQMTPAPRPLWHGSGTAGQVGSAPAQTCRSCCSYRRV